MCRQWGPRQGPEAIRTLEGSFPGGVVSNLRLTKYLAKVTGWRVEEFFFFLSDWTASVKERQASLSLASSIKGVPCRKVTLAELQNLFRDLDFLLDIQDKGLNLHELSS